MALIYNPCFMLSPAKAGLPATKQGKERMTPPFSLAQLLQSLFCTLLKDHLKQDFLSWATLNKISQGGLA